MVSTQLKKKNKGFASQVIDKIRKVLIWTVFLLPLVLSFIFSLEENGSHCWFSWCAFIQIII